MALFKKRASRSLSWLRYRQDQKADGNIDDVQLLDAKAYFLNSMP